MKKLFLIFSCLMAFSAFGQQEINSRLSEIGQAKADLEGIIDTKPYRGPEHSVIKKYFTELKSLIEDLEAYPKYKRRFNSSVRSTGVEAFCGSLILDKARLTSLVRNCTKNSFFLCTEDVREVAKINQDLAATLDEDLKTQFENLAKCKD